MDVWIKREKNISCGALETINQDFGAMKPIDIIL